MKKIFILALVSVMLLAGCSQKQTITNDNGNGNSNSENQETVETTEAVDFSPTIPESPEHILGEYENYEVLHQDEDFGVNVENPKTCAILFNVSNNKYKIAQTEEGRYEIRETESDDLLCVCGCSIPEVKETLLETGTTVTQITSHDDTVSMDLIRMPQVQGYNELAYFLVCNYGCEQNVLNLVFAIEKGDKSIESCDTEVLGYIDEIASSLNFYCPLCNR